MDVEDAHAGFAITPCGTRVYTANPGINVVSVIDTSTNSVISTIPVGIKPNGVAITQDGSKIYVANSASCSVSIIDTSTNTVISTIPLKGNPVRIKIFPEGEKVCVTLLSPGCVQEVSL